jgi:hypothetical protein
MVKTRKKITIFNPTGNVEILVRAEQY